MHAQHTTSRTGNTREAFAGEQQQQQQPKLVPQYSQNLNGARKKKEKEMLVNCADT